MIKVKFSLHSKILLSFMLLVAFIFVKVYFDLNRSLTKHTYERIRSNISKQVVLSKTLLESQFQSDMTFAEIDDIADHISSILDLRVTIIDRNGVVKGDSDLDTIILPEIENHKTRPEVVDALAGKTGESRRFSKTVNKSMLYMAVLYGDTTAGGIIRLSVPLVEIANVTDNLRKVLITALISSFLLVLVISYFVSRRITKSLKEIAGIAHRIAAGDYSCRIDIRSNDEIGYLAKVFNYMTTQIKKNIQDVTVSRSKLEAVLYSMTEGVMVVGLDENILLMNDNLIKMLHVNVDPNGKNPLEIIRNMEIQDIVTKTLNSMEGVSRKEISVILPEEKKLDVYSTLFRVNEKIAGAVFVFHDVTELRNLENIRKDFVANVSHELRTPVASIKGYAETLLDGAMEDKSCAKDFINIIHSDAGRLANLISDLLALSKVEQKAPQLRLHSVSLKFLLRRVFDVVKPQAEKKQISLVDEIPEDFPKVKIDDDKIIQVLLNLIVNAINYSKEKDQVCISAEIDKSFAKVHVTDTGIGIAEVHQGRLFERFYRVDKGRSKEAGGTGLGLAIAKHIIQSHGGHISVTSRIGYGSTFTFTLPLSK